MTLLQPLCSVLNRWIDETSRAEDSAGHNYYARRHAVQALGPIHYLIWLEDLHEKKNIMLGDCIWIGLLYGAELIHDMLIAPFNIIACHRS